LPDGGLRVLYGLIDLGSNTIRLCVYSCENGGFSLLLNEKSFVGLVGYVENGRMNAYGCAKAIKTIQKFQRLASCINVTKLHIFATASLRNIINTAEVVERIHAETGLRPDVLSGEEESHFGFTGANSTLKLDSGLYVDIGGGSTELVYFKNDRALHETSIPAGCLNLYLEHVKELLPDKKERRAIRAAVREELSRVDWLYGVKTQTICGVGGTIRALKKYRAETASGNGTPLDAGYVRAFIDTMGDPKNLGYKPLLRVMPDRIHTIVPGLLILDEVLLESGAQQIYVSKHGVREGYLVSKVLAGEDALG
ncbi:MAG TPA: hypothetical protein VN366_02435, partial [Feifaniaceae bacterium]|nr:hypothetical protein [Feifaniaceae bacterium]